jgi:hypothetical protein
MQSGTKSQAKRPLLLGRFWGELGMPEPNTQALKQLCVVISKAQTCDPEKLNDPFCDHSRWRFFFQSSTRISEPFWDSI